MPQFRIKVNVSHLSTSGKPHALAASLLSLALYHLSPARHCERSEAIRYLSPPPLPSYPPPTSPNWLVAAREVVRKPHSAPPPAANPRDTAPKKVWPRSSARPATCRPGRNPPRRPHYRSRNPRRSLRICGTVRVPLFSDTQNQ
jgi:hypothetical protein